MFPRKAIKRANVGTLCGDRGTVCDERQLSQTINVVISENGTSPKVSQFLPCNVLSPKGTLGAMQEVRRHLGNFGCQP